MATRDSSRRALLGAISLTPVAGLLTQFHSSPPVPKQAAGAEPGMICEDTGPGDADDTDGTGNPP